MTVEDLRHLFDYGHWANGKLFEVIGRLTADEFAGPLSGPHGSVRNTMVHLLSAEWGWLDRCGGPGRGPQLKPDDYPTPDALRGLWRTVEGHARVFLSTLTDGDVTREVAYSLPAGPTHALTVGEMLLHAANHGTHHRGQVSLVLRARGHSPDNFDLLLFDIERRGRAGT